MRPFNFANLAERIASEARAGMGVPFDAVAALHGAAESIMVTDTELTAPGPRIVYVNPAMERMTGWRIDELIGQTPRLFQGPMTDLSIFDGMKSILSAGETWRGETFNYRKDGSTYRLQWTIAPIRDPATGATTHYLAVERDVTEAYENRRQLDEAYEKLREADRSKTDFLSVVTHELRTPLNAIVGHAELLHSEALGPLGNPAYKWHAGLVEEQAGALIEMVNNILDYTKSSAGMLNLELDAEDLARLTRLVIDLLSALAAKRGIVVVAEFPGPLIAWVDALRMRQILLNVIGNAVKFAKTGGRVVVSGQRGRDAVTIRVVDDGPGIAPEHHQRIFDPFIQVESSLSRSHQGTGLGLAISRRLIELHGGRISVESEPGQGAAFLIEVPAVTTPD